MQFNNVGSLVGGTGACAFTIAKCFPDMDRAIYTFGSPSRELLEECKIEGVEVFSNKVSTEQAIDEFKPDFVILHNTNPGRIPEMDPRIPVIFYQHSNFSMARASRDRSDVFFVCSRHLARQAGVDEKFVLYQPVPLPPRKSVVRGSIPTIGRICTPKASKWKVEDFSEVYRHLSGRFPEVQFEFVGAPDSVRPVISGILGDRAVFHNPSWEQRWRLREWHGVLYSSSLEESYGRVVCEAQRAGCVPIVSRLGGFVEQINPGVTGALCASPEEYGDAVQMLLDEKYDLGKMKEAGDFRGGANQFRGRLIEVLKVLFDAKNGG